MQLTTLSKHNIEWSTENAEGFFDIFKAIQTGDYETLKIKLHEQQKNLNYEGLDLGFIYHSKAVLSESDQVISVLPDKYAPTTLPGSRAPYVKLIKDKETISTFDLFEKEYVLLVGSDGYAWQTAAKEIALKMSLPLKNYRVATDGDLIDAENVWHNIYEITITGAVLVRPDGHVAWRSKEMITNPLEQLTKVFSIE
jgi:putative polyketide hydroxylase